LNPGPLLSLSPMIWPPARLMMPLVRSVPEPATKIASAVAVIRPALVIESDGPPLVTASMRMAARSAPVASIVPVAVLFRLFKPLSKTISPSPRC